MPIPKSKGDDALIKSVCARLKPWFGEPTSVYRDEVNDWVHVDVHIVSPEEERPQVTLFTTGMSERFMTVPAREPKLARTAELVMTLPPDWLFDQATLEDPRRFWPIAWLRFLARFPFKRRTYLSPAHTVPGMVDPTLPVRPTPFDAALLTFPARLPLAARTFPRVGSRETTVVAAVCPIFESERAFAIDHGVNRLLARFAERGVDPEKVNVDRAAVA
jgi:hypothetical protein